MAGQIVNSIKFGSLLKSRWGAIIVANKGTSEVVGIGKVTRGYYFEDISEHGHRLKVDWYDKTLRKVDMPGWRKTLIPLDKATLNMILGASAQFAPIPNTLFTKTSFDLLAELLAQPRKETYLGKKDEYHKHVIDPFQSLFKAAIAKLSPRNSGMCRNREKCIFTNS